MIFLNFKTYQSGTGMRAVSMAKLAEEISKDSGIKIIPIVQVGDIKEVIDNVQIEVWSQKIDPVTFGANTGSVLPESVVEDGASGTVLNHSENRFDNFETLSKTQDRAKEVGLKTLIFAKDLEELEKICSLSPNYISYEPQTLIGSKDISVAIAEPEIIVEASEIAKKAGIPLIVGAGVHSNKDVSISLSLGAIGIAVASDVMMSNNPREELLDLIEGFK